MVSVIIPTYNRARIVRRAIESVLAQTHEDLEVIVVDDGSTDDTQTVVSGIPDARVRYVCQSNQGACAARNHGVDLARGEYIAFHDSDDIWYPEKLAKQLQTLKAHQASIVCCRLAEPQKDGGMLLIPQVFTEGFRTCRDNLFGIGTQTLLARREVFEAYRFDAQMPRFQEFELLCRITAKYPVYCMQEALVEYCVGADSISASPAKLLEACDLLEKKHPALFDQACDARVTIAYMLERAAQHACKNGDPQYTACLQRACAYHSRQRALKLRLILLLGLYPLYLRYRDARSRSA